MGGWTLFSYSNRLLAFFLLTSCLCACDFAAEPSRPREFLPPFSLDGANKFKPDSTAKTEAIKNLFTPPANKSSCSYLTDLARSKFDPLQRFRLISAVRVELGSNGNNARGEKEIFSIYGKVDIAAAPIYQFALLGQSIPNRKEFLDLVRRETNNGLGVLNPIAHLYKLLLKMGITDFYNQRNKIIQDRIEEALPTTFSAGGGMVSLRGSFPEAMLRNGADNLADLAPLPGDNASTRARKAMVLGDVLSVYSKATPVYKSVRWGDFQLDLEEALALSLRDFNGTDMKEQACATALFHRALNQVLLIAGYDRAPVFNNLDLKSSYFPPFNNLLDHPHGTTFRVCPTTGYIARKGQRQVMYPSELENFDSSSTQYSLSKYLESSNQCDPFNATPRNAWEYTSYPKPALREEAGSDELLGMLQGLSQFLIAFDPSSSWWEPEQSTRGFPLANFEDLNRIASGGGVLPSKAHSLALALINIGVSLLEQKHVVILDVNFKETKDSSQAMALRIAERARDFGDAGPIRTTVNSATQLAELAMKGQEYLERLEKWRIQAVQVHEEDLARAPNAEVRETLVIEYNKLLRSLFGSQNVLTELSSTGPGSIRDKLGHLKFASVLMAAAFAKRDKSGAIGCYAILVNDMASKVLVGEKKEGACTPLEQQRWKRLLGMAAVEFDSPLFSEMAR